MAKLFFRYSAMNAGKTLDLIKVAYNYSDRGQHACILTSNIDKRAGQNKVVSRIGIEQAAISIDDRCDLLALIKDKHQNRHINCILVDEIQFFTVEQIMQLSDIVDYLRIPVICYGLRSDYCGRSFPASAYLLTIADNIEELKTICYCGKKATFNMLLKNNIVIKDGASVVIDNSELKDNNTCFISVCRLHWKSATWTLESV